MYPDFADFAEVDSEIDARYPYSKSGDILSPAKLWDDIRQMGQGACSNYATAKLRMLVERGWPIEALRLACVYVEPMVGVQKNERYHGVLVASHPERGEWMIDSRQPRPVPVTELEMLGYEPDRIQEFGGSLNWSEWKSNEEVK